ncbi:MAG: thymidine phosphorylase [Acidobacteria bacterium]|nr:thymidine phosphorylase [Acidobacteriota bacterium]
MRMYDLIYKKKMGGALTPEQIAFWVEGAAQGRLPDEQSAALLMAICWRGMDTEETLALTLAMRDSGDRVDLSGIPGVKVDKHSTGGVGDKTTLVLGPIVAACGVPCAMFSGRGLGHTGGTVDKYAAIPGLRVELSQDQFRESLRRTGFANSAQTGDICPADRKLYALRDVTATVESIPLITASIMSKKLAGGSDALVLDVKCGDGAFMKTLDDATALARSMVQVGQAHGMRIKALITRMEEPLGWAIGNALEIMEAVEILKGMHGEGDLARMSLRLAAEMLVLGGAAPDLPAAEARVAEVVRNGRALQVFRDWVRENGGDPLALDDFTRLPQASHFIKVPAPRSGFVHTVDSRALGILAMELGAGRRNKDDQLDLGVGIRVHVRPGDRVEQGQPLVTLHARGPAVPPWPEDLIQVFDQAPEVTPWLLGEIS